MTKMRVQLKIQVIAMESNEIYDEGDVITNLQTVLNEEYRTQTTLTIKNDKLFWSETIGITETLTEINLKK